MINDREYPIIKEHTHIYLFIYLLLLLDTGSNNGVYEASYCGNVELIREGRDGEWKYSSKDRVYKYDNVF